MCLNDKIENMYTQLIVFLTNMHLIDKLKIYVFK